MALPFLFPSYSLHIFLNPNIVSSHFASLGPTFLLVLLPYPSPSFFSSLPKPKTSSFHQTPNTGVPTPFLLFLPPLPILHPAMALPVRALPRALGPLARQAVCAAPRVLAPRSFATALTSSQRPVLAIPQFAAVQSRGVKTIDFAGVPETVYGMLWHFSLWYSFETNCMELPTYCPERSDWPREKLLVRNQTSYYSLLRWRRKCILVHTIEEVSLFLIWILHLQEYFKNDTLALIGYGSQGMFLPFVTSTIADNLWLTVGYYRTWTGS